MHAINNDSPFAYLDDMNVAGDFTCWLSNQNVGAVH
jgi:hypothetical protein